MIDCMSHPSEETRQPLPAATLLSTWPVGPRGRRGALAAIGVSVLLFALAAPFAEQPLPQVWAFIPIYESALVLNDLTTAVLLVGLFRIARSRAVLLLAAGYLFTALMTIAHGLSFPGLFSPAGLLSAGPQSTAWLYMFWHGGFPLFVIGYALLAGTPRDLVPNGSSDKRAVAGLGAGVGAVVACFAWLVVSAHNTLPPIMVGNHYTPAMTGVVSTVWLASLVALGLLWRRRSRTVLDLSLMVVMCAWLLDIALSAVFNAGRFDLGFYAGRIYGLLAASVVLGALLLENGRLYAQLAQAHALEQQRAGDLERLSERLESLNAQLGDSNQQLQEQSRFKSEFLANMSHELRTPLNAVIGFSEMLRDGLAGDSEKQRSFASHIFRSGHHLLALINDILDLSKIEAGKAEISVEPVHLESALADAVALILQQAQTKRIQVVVDHLGAPDVIHADRRRFQQILLNLLANATKFTPEGGVVRLSVRDVDKAHATGALPGFGEGMRMPLRAGRFERFAEISISDTGIGIAIEDLRRLFVPFTQVRNALTRSREGTGLGLVMVHRLAELHGGTVAVTSAPGRGSCFTVWLPLRGDLPASADAAPALSTERPQSPLALIVEDHDEAAELMRVQLEGSGFRVRRVASAEAALALVDAFVPDVITLDILLPGMDGWEFLARLKDTSTWDSVPVVVVSVAADHGRGFSLGAALVLQKPIGRDALAKGLAHLGLASKPERAVTVLVIDDDASAVELLATQLRQRQYIVLRALGGREGIELARQFQPDLIALDLEMPDVNGFDVVEALKGEAVTARIPIVVVTAKDLTPADRSHLNGHILEIVGKAEFNHGRFISEVQRALAKPA
jgi:signal transduction histidine kinase/CheY-like chemotaxis protein